MSESPEFSLVLNAFREVQAELGQAPASGALLFPKISQALDAVGRLPRNALLFGIGADGLPLLLSLRDPRPGPILIIGDRHSGKTALLKAMLWAAERLNPPGSLYFVVLSRSPGEWERFLRSAYLAGVWLVGEPETEMLLYELARRAEARQERAPILFLFDGLEVIQRMETASQENLRFLLVHGPAASIWPVVTVNAEQALTLPNWLAYFRTRIYGRITHPETGEELTPLPGAPLTGLYPGFQFCIREKSRWLSFWLPGMAE